MIVTEIIHHLVDIFCKCNVLSGNDHYGICMLCKNLCISNHSRWWGIDNDVIHNLTKVLGVVLNGVMTFQSIADSPVGDHYSRYSRYGRYGRYGKYTNNKEV